MNYNDVKIESIKSEWTNETFQIEIDNTVGVFRIHCVNEARANARQEKWVAIRTYFESIIPTGNYSGSFEVDKMTDLLLFVERKQQWILERIKRKDY